MMLKAIREFTDRLSGGGSASIAVPPMDGALKPNTALDGAEDLFGVADPQDLASDGKTLLLADGPRLHRIDGTSATQIREFDAKITALTSLPDGAIAVALGGTRVEIYARQQATAPESVFTHQGMTCINALSRDSDGSLIATNGSARFGTEDWVWDLMNHGKTGSVWCLDPVSKQVKCRAGGLQHPFGAVAMSDGILVAESWRHRLVRIGDDGVPRVMLNHLPVYPSRLTPAEGGGWWMTAFASRTQLVEFVLREPVFRRRMMAEIHPDHWIAPRLASGRSLLEPIQGAHVTMMGVVKPWAPPRSYGLIVRLDAEARPVFSLHSRFDGKQHGIVAAVEHQGFLYGIARGSGRLLRLEIQQLVREFGK